MVIVTENGVADLRGLSPKERAELIIENCAHDDFKDKLRDYYTRSKELCKNNHTPHILREALSWHDKYLKEGSM